jgi:hypothetical protein
MDTTRRRFLHGATAAGALALAGCAGDSDGTDTPPDDSSSAEVPAWTEWLPAPAELSGEAYAMATIGTDIAEYESQFSTEFYTGISDIFGTFDGVSLSSTDRLVVGAQGYYLFDGDVDTAAVEESLSMTLGMEGSDESYAGYDLYEGSSGGAAAISGDALLLAVGSVADEPPTNLKAFIDAKRGEVERYTEASDDCARLAAGLGDAHIASGRVEPENPTFDGLVARGSAWTAEGETTAFRAPVVFESADSADGDAVGEWVADSGFFSLFTETSVEASGRVVTVVGTAPTGDIERPTVPWDRQVSTSPPQAAFAFDYEAVADGTGLLEITHEGGDTIEAAALTVRGSGFADVSGSTLTDSGQWPAGDDGEVSAGDSVVVGVRSDYDITLVWASTSGDQTATIATDQGPDA